MATAYTSLLGLALPVTGELSGSWGDTVNDSITSLLDSAISGTTTLSADADVTLTSSDGVADQARQAILLWTAGGSTTRNITAPAQSKAYFVINKTSSTQSIVIRGAGPTTGVTVLAGTQSLVVWDGADFVEVASGNVDGPASSTDNAVARFDGTTGKLIQNSVVTIADTSGNMAGVGTLGVGAITTSGALTYGGVTLSNSVTGTGSMVLNTSPTLVTPALGTPASGVVTNLTGTASININGTVGATTANTGAFTTLSASSTVSGTGFSTYLASPPAIGGTAAAAVSATTLTTSSTVTHNGGTANGVAYLNGSKVLTTGSALTFDGSRLIVKGGNAGQFVLDNTNEQYVQALFQRNGTANTGADFLLDGSGNTFNFRNLAANMPFVWHLSPSPGAPSEQMRLTSTGLGIGTSSPTAKLTVAGDSLVSVASGNIGYGWLSGSTNYSLYLNAADNSLRLYSSVGTAGDKLIVSSSGNLGLGVTPSASNLPTLQSTVAILVGSSETDVTSNAYYNSGWKYVGTGLATQYQANSGLHKWYTAPSGTAGNAISFTQAMTLDASGLLQIGTTSNTGGARLEVVSNATSAITTRSAASGAGQTVMSIRAVDLGATEFANAQYNALSHAWRLSSGTAAMTLDASGNLGVGTTSPISKLHVFKSSGNQLQLQCDNTGTVSIDMGGTTTPAKGGIGFSDNADALFFRTNSTERARITSGGDLIQTVNTTAATLTTNGTLTFSIVDNSTLRISVRGSDGTTRTATVALT